MRGLEAYFVYLSRPVVRCSGLGMVRQPRLSSWGHYCGLTEGSIDRGYCVGNYQVNSKSMPVTGVTRLSALMPDDQDAQLLALGAVNH